MEAQRHTVYCSLKLATLVKGFKGIVLHIGAYTDVLELGAFYYTFYIHDISIESAALVRGFTYLSNSRSLTPIYLMR